MMSARRKSEVEFSLTTFPHAPEIQRFYLFIHSNPPIFHLGSLKPTSICEQVHSIDGVSPWLLIIHLLRLASSQARIWLGEVLRTRFDEQISTCYLLSDGELLYVLTLYFNSKLYCYFISIPV
ncbi:hypothetical protein Hanom_Chr07g00665261 [Helianthus anomalus]